MLNITLFQSAEGITLKNSYFNSLTRIMPMPFLGASGEIRTGDGRFPSTDIKKYIEAKFAGFNTNIQVVTGNQIVSQPPANHYYIIYSALPNLEFTANNFTLFYDRLRAIRRGLATTSLKHRRIAFIFTNEPINVRNTTIKFIGEMLGMQNSQFGFMGSSNPSNERWANSNVQTLKNKLTFSTKPLPFSKSKQELYDGAWVMKLKRPINTNFTVLNDEFFDGAVYTQNGSGIKNIIGPRKNYFTDPTEEDMDGFALFLEAGRYTVSCLPTDEHSMLMPEIYPYLAETTSTRNGTSIPIGEKCSQLNDNSKLANQTCDPVNILFNGAVNNYSFTLEKNGFVSFGIKNKDIDRQTNDSRLQSSYFGNYQLRIAGTNHYNYNSSKFGSGRKDFIYSFPKPPCFVYSASERELDPLRGKTLYDFVEQAKIDHPNNLVEYLQGEGYDLVYNKINGTLEAFLFNTIDQSSALPSAGFIAAISYPVVINGSIQNIKMIVREEDYVLDYVPEQGEYVLATNIMQFANGSWENVGGAIKKEFFVNALSTSGSTPVNPTSPPVNPTSTPVNPTQPPPTPTPTTPACSKRNCTGNTSHPLVDCGYLDRPTSFYYPNSPAEFGQFDCAQCKCVSPSFP